MKGSHSREDCTPTARSRGRIGKRFGGDTRVVNAVLGEPMVIRRWRLEESICPSILCWKVLGGMETGLC